MNRTTQASGPNRDRGFGLIEVIIAIVILGLVSIVMLPVLVTGLTVAGNQATVASATQLLNDTIEEIRPIAADPTIDCADVEITNPLIDGRGVALTARSTVISNQHRGANDASGNPTIAKDDFCEGFSAPAALTVKVTVVRDSDGRELASATTILSVMTPPEEP